MKIYSYKNGEKAYFTKEGKKIITDDEVKLLYESIDAFGYVTETFAGEYIAKKIGTRPFCEPSTSKMIEYMHKHNVTMKMEDGKIKENGNKITIEKVFEGETLVAWQAYSEWGEFIYENDMTIDELNSHVNWN